MDIIDIACVAFALGAITGVAAAELTGAGIDDNIGVTLWVWVCWVEICEVYEVSIRVSVGNFVDIRVFDQTDDYNVGLFEAFFGATTT